jgi:hypothetical protein
MKSHPSSAAPRRRRPRPLPEACAALGEKRGHRELRELHPAPLAAPGLSERPAVALAAAGIPPHDPCDFRATRAVRAFPPPPPSFTPVPLRARRDGWTPARQFAYILALARFGHGGRAAALVGMTEQSACRLRRRPEAEAFRDLCEAAVHVAKVRRGEPRAMRRRGLGREPREVRFFASMEAELSTPLKLPRQVPPSSEPERTMSAARSNPSFLIASPPGKSQGGG